MLLACGIEPVTLMRVLRLLSVARLELLGLGLGDGHGRRVQFVCREQIEHFRPQLERLIDERVALVEAACASARYWSAERGCGP